MGLDPRNYQTLPDGRVRIAGHATSGKTALVLLIFGLVWTSFSAFVFSGLLFSENDAPNFIVGLMAVVFISVGLGLMAAGIVNIVRGVLVSRRLAPAAVIVDRLPLRLGDRLTVSFEQQTKQHCTVNSVTVALHCEEWARYRVGTDTRTETHLAVDDTTTLDISGDAQALSQLVGSATFKIPVESMHSFDASNNRITWRLRVKTDIDGWADYAADFPLQVIPRIAPEAGGGES